ncbi:hypothetical protein HanPSC8_Chr03g0109141 [Helianthus annuus]|nr:hypothetical protein HanPSC8_Chr03g0109141 [Helianthus annuus]
MEVENPVTREALCEDDDVDVDDEIDDDSDELFDSVCAFCDNGGDVLLCEGKCMRSFHPTVDAGLDTCCESLGFENAAQYEVFPCVSATCGHFYHPECVANLLYPSEADGAWLVNLKVK